MLERFEPCVGVSRGIVFAIVPRFKRSLVRASPGSGLGKSPGPLRPTCTWRRVAWQTLPTNHLNRRVPDRPPGHYEHAVLSGNPGTGDPLRLGLIRVRYHNLDWRTQGAMRVDIESGRIHFHRV